MLDLCVFFITIMIFVWIKQHPYVNVWTKGLVGIATALVGSGIVYWGNGYGKVLVNYWVILATLVLGSYIMNTWDQLKSK